MREFKDSDGSAWIATTVAERGPDYKGRYHLVMRPVDGGEGVELTDVRWNSERTALRTVQTMSLVELRRRLRSARGRDEASPVR